MEEKEPRRVKKRLRRDPGEENLESLVMPLLSETGGTVDGGTAEEVFRGEERRRRRKVPADHEGGEDVHGKMKVGAYYFIFYYLGYALHVLFYYYYKIYISCTSQQGNVNINEQ